MKVTVAIICVLALLSNGLLGGTSGTEMQGARPESPINVITDKTDYYAGEMVKIQGSVPVLTNGHEVNVIVKDANGKTFAKLRVKPTSDSKFAASFQIPLYDKLFAKGIWAINVGYAIWGAKVEINVLVGEKPVVFSVTISKPQLVMTSNNTIDMRVGDKVMIISEIKNNEERDQRVFYIVQVKDDVGTTVLLTWLTRTFSANEVSRLSVTWVPELEGEYNVETFAWGDIKTPTPLSPSQSVNQTIAG